MVGQRRRSSRRKKLAGSHQRSWLWGRNAVIETLKAGRWIPRELVLAESAASDMTAQIHEFARTLDITLQVESHERLTNLVHARDHQGILARMPPFPYVSVSATLEQADSPALFLILDAIQDPFNFGAVCRAACVYGADGVIVGTSNQADVTPHVVRSSAGAVSRLEIAKTDDLSAAVHSIRSAGVKVIGTGPRADRRIDQVDMTGSVAVIIGSEGPGLGSELEAACDEVVRIPQAVTFDSLNAAVSAGILCYEIHRQRLPQG